MAHPSSGGQESRRPDLETFEEIDIEMMMRRMIGLHLMPARNVSRQSGTFKVVKLKSLLANAGQTFEREPDGSYSRGSWDFDERSFLTKEYGLEEPLDDREDALYTDLFDQELITTNRIWVNLLTALERRIVKKVVADTVTAGHTTNAAARWTDKTNATPIDDIEVAVKAIRKRTGVYPDTLALNYGVRRDLAHCEQVIQRVNSQGAGDRTEPGDITDEMLARVFQLRRVVTSDAIENGANPGQAVDISDLWPRESAVLCKVAQTDDMREACIGRTLHWGGDGSQIGSENKIGIVEQYREAKVRGEVFRVRHETQEHTVYQEIAQVIEGVATAV